MAEVAVLWAMITSFAHQTGGRMRSEAGASAVEWAIIAACVAGLALAVYGIIKAKVLSKANEIPTG